MLDLRKRSKSHQFLGHLAAKTVGTIDYQDSLGTDKPDLYAEHKKCFWLVDDLNDVLIDRTSKTEVQDIVRRLLLAVARHFRHEEMVFARFGYLDGPRHRELHSQILARYRQLSGELNDAQRPADWLECGSLIARMLEEHLTEEQVIYGT